MSKVIKLNFAKKVRYIFDNETEENTQLGEKVLNHFGSFIDNSWEMSDLKRFHKVLRECGLSVSEFLSKEWPSPSPTPRPKKKRVVKKKPVVEKEPSEEKVPAKKKVVRKKFTSASTKAKTKRKKK